MEQVPQVTITGEMTMGAVMAALPGGRRALFARYHLGGCSSCAYAETETLAELCQRSELEVAEVVAHLLESHVHDLEMLVSPVEAQKMLVSPAPPRLLDVRTREEFEAVAVEGAEFLTQDLQQAVFAGDPEATVLLMDHSGRDVLDKVAWFRGHGLKRTFGVRGGIDAWSLEVDAAVGRYRVELE